MPDARSSLGFPGTVTRPDFVACSRRLLDQLQDAIRLRHYSIRTEEAYVEWVPRYVRFCGLRHPLDCGVGDVESFLTHSRSRGQCRGIDLLYGTGMRVLECLRLRVKEVDFGRREIVVREGKGFRDRVTMMRLLLFVSAIDENEIGKALESAAHARNLDPGDV